MKHAWAQLEAHKREEAERQQARQQREGGNGKAGQASGGGAGSRAGGGPAFRGTATSEANIEAHASDQNKGSSSARS